MASSTAAVEASDLLQPTTTSHNDDDDDDVNNQNQATMPRFAEWLHCICLVTFDLELGQAMEVSWNKFNFYLSSLLNFKIGFSWSIPHIFIWPNRKK